MAPPSEHFDLALHRGVWNASLLDVDTGVIDMHYCCASQRKTQIIEGYRSLPVMFMKNIDFLGAWGNAVQNRRAMLGAS